MTWRDYDRHAFGGSYARYRAARVTIVDVVRKIMCSMFQRHRLRREFPAQQCATCGERLSMQGRCWWCENAGAK